MQKYLTQRMLQVLLTAFLSSILIFSIIRLAPGNPISFLYAPGMTQKDKQAIAHKYGLDQPIYVQYMRWMSTTLQGDLGRSMINGRPVNELLIDRLINTLMLAGLALTMNVIIGISTGVIAAQRHGSLLDVGTMTIAILSYSIPPFWLGLILLLIFSVWLKWFPIGGVGSFKHIVLPAVSLGASTAALTARMTRAAMLEILNSDYIRTARAKGLRESRVLIVHALKNALIPIITIIGQMTGMMVAGAVVTETIFAYPGIGYTLVKSITQRDYPIIQATLLVSTFGYLLINLMVDIAYSFVDPRIRYG